MIDQINISFWFLGVISGLMMSAGAVIFMLVIANRGKNEKTE